MNVASANSLPRDMIAPEPAHAHVLSRHPHAAFPTVQHTAPSRAGTFVTRIVPYTDLQDSDLIVDAIYEGEPSGSINNEPISRLVIAATRAASARWAARPS